MGDKRTILIASVIFLIALSAVSFAYSCSDPHCLGYDGLSATRPSVLPRQNMLTGHATMLSGSIIQETRRGTSGAGSRNLDIRRYPVDLKVQNNVSLGLGDVIDFTLGGTKFVANVISYSQQNVQIRFMPTREYSNLTPGETVTYDVNHDGGSDFSLTMGTPTKYEAPFFISPAGIAPALPQSEPSMITTVVPSPQTEGSSMQSPQSPTYQPSSQSPASTPTPSPPVYQSQSPPQTSYPSQPYTDSAPQYPPSSLPAENIPSAPTYQTPQSYQSSPESFGESAPNIVESIPAEIPSSAPVQSGFGPFEWAVVGSGMLIALLGLAAVVVVHREREHVDTVEKYLMDSLSSRVPIPTAMQALAEAGWSKRLTGKACGRIAHSYKDNLLSRGMDARKVREQLSAAGMPEDVLDEVFGKIAS